MPNLKIILASQSPRRSELLKMAGIPFEVVNPKVNEDYPNDMLLKNVPIFLAKKKAQSLSHLLTDDTVIIAADTMVYVNRAIVGKPTDRLDAIKMLSDISNRKHVVVTGFCILSNQKEFSSHGLSHVYFNSLEQQEIEHYVDHYKPYDKAGGYGAQDWIGAIGIHTIEGDFYNVMGLPINQVYRALKKEFGYQPF